MKQFSTVSGSPITIGLGTGTAVKNLKRSNPDDKEKSDEIVKILNYAVKEAGYNHIDTAEIYLTHQEVGRVLKESGISRDNLWISTKYSVHSSMVQKKYFTPTDFINDTLKEFDTDYIDSLLIHHPFFHPSQSTKKYTLASLWEEFIQIKKSGKVRYIGVSNCNVQQLQQLMAISDNLGGKEFYPAINQIEFHACLQNQSPGIVKFCQENNIQVQAYSPLTPLVKVGDGNPIMQHLLSSLEGKYKKTKAQLLLRYCLEKGILPITTSSKQARLSEFIDIYDFTIAREDIEQIDSAGSKTPYQVYFNGLF
ncbi:uncharacterized protein J8A68_004319 [[Candida] subhashii]|uniref:NADP-dependent oxidoreductase domain-containing protein n=1 Tax=[Candida] subhashii TaxID=561895 RepID=A0A8J5UKP3_9ASCO|nr:uncharacterized protein J8A68_004319 [[Candida] subhashii]KAG7662191.1 hypothetical protein J8A68_004319 [[Candida] subhashii]